MRPLIGLSNTALVADARFLEILRRGDNCLPRVRPFGSRKMAAAPHGARLADGSFPRLRRGPRNRLARLAPAIRRRAALMATAVLLEALQALTPDRHADLQAGLFGASGALTVAVLAELFVQLQRQRYALSQSWT